MRGFVIDMRGEERILSDDFTGDPAEQCGAAPDDHREPLQQCHDDGGAGHDQRNADRESEHQESVASARRHGDGDDIVKTHHRIGDGDDLYRVPQIIDGLDLGMSAVVLFRTEKLDGDPDKKESADQLHIRHGHERRHRSGEDDAETDGDERAERDAPNPLLGRQLAASERDDDSVVARQKEVDPDDLKDGEPKSRIVDSHSALAPYPRAVREPVPLGPGRSHTLCREKRQGQDRDI